MSISEIITLKRHSFETIEQTAFNFNDKVITHSICHIVAPRSQFIKTCLANALILLSTRLCARCLWSLKIRAYERIPFRGPRFHGWGWGHIITPQLNSIIAPVRFIITIVLTSNNNNRKMRENKIKKEHALTSEPEKEVPLFAVQRFFS